MITKHYYVQTLNKTTFIVMEVVTDHSKGMFGNELSRKPYHVGYREKDYANVLCNQLNGGAVKHVGWVVDNLVEPNPELAEQVIHPLTY